LHDALPIIAKKIASIDNISKLSSINKALITSPIIKLAEPKWIIAFLPILSLIFPETIPINVAAMNEGNRTHETLLNSIPYTVLRTNPKVKDRIRKEKYKLNSTNNALKNL